MGLARLILEKIEAKCRVRMSTVYVNQNGVKVIDGEALVICPPIDL